jgi:LPS export ABC transporter protein LptC
MSRGQLRFIIGIAVVLLLVTIGYHLTVNVRAQKERDKVIEKLVADLPPETEQRMQNFRRVKVRDGKKVWEIAARQARYSGESGEVTVDAPEVALYFGDGEVIALRCREGRVYLNAGEQEVTRIELKGDLEMRIGDFLLNTQEAVYESEHNIISSSAPVQVVGRGFTVEGQGYTIAVADKRLTLNAAVRTTLNKGEG